MELMIINTTADSKILKSSNISFNLFVTNELSYRYHLDEPTFIFIGNRSNFFVFFHCSMKFL